jgi:hypothetical protein
VWPGPAPASVPWLNPHLTVMYRDRIAAIVDLLGIADLLIGTIALTEKSSVSQNRMSVCFPQGNGSSNFDVTSPALDTINSLPPS